VPTEPLASPREVRIADFRVKEALDWLLQVSGSWHVMLDLRNIMSGCLHRGPGVGDPAP